MLNETIKKTLLEKAEKISINIHDLKSAVWDKNIYGLEPELAVGGWSYDENEEWQIQLKEMASRVKEDGLCEYVDLSEDEDLDGEMTKEAYLWLLSLAGEE